MSRQIKVPPTPEVSPKQSSPLTEGSSNGNSSNPFTRSRNGHPLFHPFHVGSRSTACIRNHKPPKPPTHPKTPYSGYLKKVAKAVQVKNPNMKTTDLPKIIQKQWEALPHDEKKQFEGEYQMKINECTMSMESYRSSSDYKSWITARSKAEEAAEEAQSGQKSIRIFKTSLQSAADKEDVQEGEFEEKMIARARYKRNHELINRIFNDEVVTIVNNRRPTGNMLMHLRSMELHQRNLEYEIDDIEKKFLEKKRKIVESNKSFLEEISKFKSPVKDKQAQQVRHSKSFMKIEQTIDFDKNQNSAYQQCPEKVELGISSLGTSVSFLNSKRPDASLEQRTSISSITQKEMSLQVEIQRQDCQEKGFGLEQLCTSEPQCGIFSSKQNFGQNETTHPNFTPSDSRSEMPILSNLQDGMQNNELPAEKRISDQPLNFNESEIVSSAPSMRIANHHQQQQQNPAIPNIKQSPAFMTQNPSSTIVSHTNEEADQSRFCSPQAEMLQRTEHSKETGFHNQATNLGEDKGRRINHSENGSHPFEEVIACQNQINQNYKGYSTFPQEIVLRSNVSQWKQGSQQLLFPSSEIEIQNKANGLPSQFEKDQSGMKISHSLGSTGSEAGIYYLSQLVANQNQIISNPLDSNPTVPAVVQKKRKTQQSKSSNPRSRLQKNVIEPKSQMNGSESRAFFGYPNTSHNQAILHLKRCPQSAVAMPLVLQRQRMQLPLLTNVQNGMIGLATKPKTQLLHAAQLPKSFNLGYISNATSNVYFNQNQVNQNFSDLSAVLPQRAANVIPAASMIAQVDDGTQQPFSTIAQMEIRKIIGGPKPLPLSSEAVCQPTGQPLYSDTLDFGIFSGQTMSSAKDSSDFVQKTFPDVCKQLGLTLSPPKDVSCTQNDSDAYNEQISYAGDSSASYSWE